MAKLNAQSETIFDSTDKDKMQITLEFVRFGKKGGVNSKEYFRINTKRRNIEERTLYMTLDDLKRIVVDAESLIQVADDELI